MPPKLKTLVIHSQVHSEVPKKTIKAALASIGASLDREEVFRPIRLEFSENYSADYSLLAEETRKWYDQELKTLISKGEYGQICFFGQAPIPLLVLLGFLTQNRIPVHIFNYNRDTQSWVHPAEQSEVVTKSINPTPNDSKGDVIVRVSSSYMVTDPSVRIIQNPLWDVHIALKDIDKNTALTHESAAKIGKEFERQMEFIFANFPQATIHLFMGVPAGTAFLIGTKIHGNCCRPIQTYVFNSHETPQHKAAIFIGGGDGGRPVLRVATVVEKVRELVANNELRMAVESCETIAKGKNKKLVTALYSQIEAYDRRRIEKGFETTEDENVEQRRIGDRILGLAEEIERRGKGQ